MSTTTLKTTKFAAAIGAALAAASMSAQAATFEADVNAQYRASAFGVQNKDVDAQTDKETGLSHLLRLGADFKNEETGIQLFTSVNVAGERWQGDRYNKVPHQHYDNTVRRSDFNFDYAYVTVPVLERCKINLGQQYSIFLLF